MQEYCLEGSSFLTSVTFFYAEYTILILEDFVQEFPGFKLFFP
jgi:hypothetical protein